MNNLSLLSYLNGGRSRVPHLYYGDLHRIRNIYSDSLIISTSCCRFAKRIAATDANQDLNLNADLFIMYGVGPTGSGAQALNSHVQGAAGNPLLSADRVNAVVDSGDLGNDFRVLIIFTIWMCDRVI